MTLRRFDKLTASQAGSTGLTTGQGGGDFTRRREGAKEERECFMIFAAREYPSSKNHETPFREEIEDIDLRRFAQMELLALS